MTVGRGVEGERERSRRRLCIEPNKGPSPTNPVSQPEPKSGNQGFSQLSHPGTPKLLLDILNGGGLFQVESNLGNERITIIT